MTDEWTTGGYFDPMDELQARRDAMSREQMTPCSMPACNCCSWHRRPSRKELKYDALVDALEDFIDFAKNTDENGWTSDIHRESISTWFGPGNFQAIKNLAE